MSKPKSTKTCQFQTTCEGGHTVLWRRKTTNYTLRTFQYLPWCDFCVIVSINTRSLEYSDHGHHHKVDKRHCVKTRLTLRLCLIRPQPDTAMSYCPHHYNRNNICDSSHVNPITLRNTLVLPAYQIDRWETMDCKMSKVNVRASIDTIKLLRFGNCFTFYR